MAGDEGATLEFLRSLSSFWTFFFGGASGKVAAPLRRLPLDRARAVRVVSLSVHTQRKIFQRPLKEFVAFGPRPLEDFFALWKSFRFLMRPLPSSEKIR